MKVRTSRKLVFTYRVMDGSKSPQSIEMKFSKNHKPELWGDEANYADFLAELCCTVNKEIAKVVDNAVLQVVEVKTIG